MKYGGAYGTDKENFTVIGFGSADRAVLLVRIEKFSLALG